MPVEGPVSEGGLAAPTPVEPRRCDERKQVTSGIASCCRLAGHPGSHWYTMDSAAQPVEGPRETTEQQNQVRRLMGERDLLLSAIAPADYAKIQARIVAISESTDAPVEGPRDNDED